MVFQTPYSFLIVPGAGNTGEFLFNSSFYMVLIFHFELSFRYI